jgi:hypothetical protein
VNRLLRRMRGPNRGKVKGDWRKLIERKVINCGRYEVLTAVKMQIEVFWVVTPCDIVVGYQRFEGPGCLHFRVE